jgi:hypothetical protein
MWVCIHVEKKYMIMIETTELIVENLAQTRFRLSPVSFKAPRFKPFKLVCRTQACQNSGLYYKHFPIVIYNFYDSAQY